MWPYNDDENGWLGQHAEAPVQITPELIDFHHQRAQELRRETLAGLANYLLGAGAELFRHLGALSSGNRAKVDASIAEFRRPTAGIAGR